MSNSTESAPELTEQTRKYLHDELATLRDQRAELGSLGADEAVSDSGDAAEQLRRADDAARIDDRLKEINRLLAAGASVPGAGVDPGLQGGLADGSTVTLRFDDGSTETLHAAAIPDAVPDVERAEALSLDSPLGQAVAAASVGDTITYDTPDGPHQAEILTIDTP